MASFEKLDYITPHRNFIINTYNLETINPKANYYFTK